MLGGANDHGQIGDGSLIDKLAPIDVSALTSPVASVAAGGQHTCALSRTGGVKCWGRNQEGELGNGTFVDSLAPVDVNELTAGVAAITAGFTHTCALTTAVKCWGYGNAVNPPFGSFFNLSTPIDVPGLRAGISVIAAGLSHTCALTSGGGAKCWGVNNTGELGNGTTTTSGTVNVIGLGAGVVDISAGGFTSCARLTSGAVKCWGNNSNGQLGNGTQNTSTTPINVVGF